MAPAFNKVCPAKLVAMAIHKLIQERVMIVSILTDCLRLLRNSAADVTGSGVAG
jgi:hypothetical protein